MEWFTTHLEPLGVGAGAVLAIWRLIKSLDKAHIVHLSARFASKEDFHRLEAKFDDMYRFILRDIHKKSAEK